MRTAVLCGSAGAVLALALGLARAGSSDTDPALVADDVLHRRALVFDAHADSTQALTYGGADLAVPQPEMHLDLPRAGVGGLDAQFFSIFALPSMFQREQLYGEALRQIAAVEKLAAANPDRVRLARTAADVRANAGAGRLSALLGVEGGHLLWPGDEKTQLAHLRELAGRGVRYMTLTWANSNDVGGSSGDAGDIRGLSPFGHKVIKEMNRLGVVVDLAHVSDATFWDAIRATDKPVLVTHSSARALTNIPRNMTDAMLKAVAKNGGATCVNFGASFLDQAFHEKERRDVWSKHYTGPPADQWRAIRANAAAITPRVPLARLVDHIQHMVKTAGADHVCLGSDFDGVPAVPAGIDDVGKLPALTAALRARGLSAADVEKVLGANILRVLEANERGARGEPTARRK